MVKIISASIQVIDNGHVRFWTLNDIEKDSIKLKDKTPKPTKPKKPTTKKN